MTTLGELRCPITDPPKDHCGWFGLVLKPKHMPEWIARKMKDRLPIVEGWLNVPNSAIDPVSEWKRWWFCYPDGSDNRDTKFRCEPLYWISKKTEYKVRVIPNGGHPFGWKSEPAKGEYTIAK